MHTRQALLRTNLLLALVAVACDSGGKAGPPPYALPAQDATLVVSVNGLAFAPGLVLAIDTDSPDYEVFPERPLQTLVGFGGAFNEKGWEALGFLSEADREEVLSRLFSQGAGLNLNLCRIPIGANDYALSRYTLDDGAEDPMMERFSIERDRQALIPYIKTAQAFHPNMRFWASPWTPPPWMKTSNTYNSGAMRNEPAVYAAYALYLARFVEEYGMEGITVEAVAVQNEPSIENDYPSCRWQPSQFDTFVRDYLGPTLQQRGLPTTILLGTFNDPKNQKHAMAVLDDAAARPFVNALGVQWNGLPIAKAARGAAPDLPIWHTETDCGNHHWESGFNPDRPQNDWAYALLTWRNIRSYLKGGAELYSLWNLVLDETGKSIDAKRPWPQNSPIVVDRTTQEVIYTPMYFAVAHFSRYVGAGSVLLDGKGSGDAVAFHQPDGKLVVVLVNPESNPQGVQVKIAEKAYYAELPAYAFATLFIDPQ
jgi:glucosylceramidase